VQTDKLFWIAVVSITAILTLSIDTMEHMTTLTKIMEELRQKGYTHEFGPRKDYLEEKSTDTKLKSDEFAVDQFYRFEGESDPGDEMTLYAITASNGMKGVFVAAQGTYSNEVSPELMAKLDVSDRHNVNTDGAVQPLNR
jgi:hypothetical protein